MQSIVIGLVIRYIVGELAAAGAAANWADIKAAVNAKVAALAASLHVGFATSEIQVAADQVLDAVAKLTQDGNGMQGVLAALAAKDVTAAAAALKAMLLKVSGGDVAKLIAAA